MAIIVDNDCSTKLAWLLNRQGNFRREGVYWSSMVEFLEVMQYHGIDNDQFNELRYALDAPRRSIVVEKHQLKPNRNWPAQRDPLVKEALVAKFAANFKARAALVSTGDEPLVVFDADPYWNERQPGECSNRLGQVLIEVRTLMAEHANNTKAIQCEHGEREESELRQVCVHILDGEAVLRYYEWSDTKDRTAERLWCERCALELSESQQYLRTICRSSCFGDFMNIKPHLAGIVGTKAVKVQQSRLQFTSSPAWLPFPSGTAVLAIAPWESLESPSFLTLMHDGRLVLVDPRAQRVQALGTVEISQLQAVHNDENEPLEIMMRVSANGRFVAICHRKGQLGIVFDLTTCQSTMLLNRDNYHVEHCLYSVAFFQYQGRTLLVHATDWNRLDISDPATGELLTQRLSPKYDENRKRPEHYLDYFHCQLHVSPNGQWLADTGWVWHPVGIVRLWSLHAWLKNAWESEDGPTVQDVTNRVWDWDAPACWIDNQTFVIWGFGDDHDSMLDAVQLFDAPTGKLIKWFAGPTGDFYFDRYLFSTGEKEGTQVWDIATGHRLLHRSDLILHHYHRRSKSFLSISPTGEWTWHRLNEV